MPNPENNFTIGIPQDKPHYRRAFILSFLIESEIKKIRLQQSRIKEDKKDSSHLNILFADIHFLLITFGNLRKLLKEIGKLFETDKTYKAITDEFLPKLDSIGIVRHNLEHILDGRLDGIGNKGKPLVEPNMFGNLIGDVYNFGGDKVNLKETIALVDILEKKLISWNKQVQINPFWLNQSMTQ